MNRPLLVAINAKFIHTNPAVRILQACCEEKGVQTVFFEFTINQHRADILRKIYEYQPDFIGFSCYIWNRKMVGELLVALKKILPHTMICLGGPEVSFRPRQALYELPSDWILCGEGENSLPDLLFALQTHTSWEHIPGLAWKDASGFHQNPPPIPTDLDTLPFLYQELGQLAHRIPYYEGSRGCPFHCAYCLSSNEKTMRFRSLPLVKKDMDRFLQAKVSQVKWVDRSFTADPKRAKAIWRYLAEHDNGITNFHFEVNAQTFPLDAIPFLNRVRPGLFQFEIGVQTTSAQTLAAVFRKDSFDQIAHVVKLLQKGQNIHLHLDLIAGLPKEDLSSFARSFDQVFSLAPSQLQLGFLKLLSGSFLGDHADELGLVGDALAPYEILSTPVLSYGDILQLKTVEKMLNIYYNSGRFPTSLSCFLKRFPSPFSAFLALGRFAESKIPDGALVKKSTWYAVLYQYICQLGENPERFAWLLKHDLNTHEKYKPFRDLPLPDLFASYRDRIRDFYGSPEQIKRHLPAYCHLPVSQIARSTHLEVYPFDPRTGEDGATALLYDYQKRNLLGQAACVSVSI